MADEVDSANEVAAVLLQASIASSLKPEGPTATGECLYCGVKVDNRRWCDNECRDDWEQEQR